MNDGIYDVTNFYPILAEYVDGEWSHEAYVPVGECFYSEISNYDVRITVPSGYTIASSGTQVDKQENEDTCTFTFLAPYVRDFVFCASTKFAWKSETYNGVTVNVLYNAENPPRANMDFYIEASFDAADRSLEAFGDAFGLYPYEELDIVLAPIDAGGMEYPNLVIITDDYIKNAFITAEMIANNDDFLEEAFEELKGTIAHEIGHQWFMGIVGSNSGMQPWQDESITSYTELVYWEFVGGNNYLLYYASSENIDLTDAAQIKILKANDELPINLPYYDYCDDDAYVFAVYGVGQAVLYQMEEIIGREEMHAVLRKYVQDNAFTNTNPSSFFDCLYEVAGTDNEKLNTLIRNTFQ